MLQLTSFTSDRRNGVSAVPTAIFAEVFRLYGKKWNIVQVQVFERTPQRGEQETYDKVQTFDLLKIDPIANNWLLNGFDQASLNATAQAMEIDALGFDYALKRSLKKHGLLRLPSAADAVLQKLT